VKTLVLICLTFALMMSLVVFAQNSSTQGGMSQQTPATEKPSTKAVSLSGKVGDGGRTFVSDKDGKSWTISNPEAVKGHEGHEVKIKAHENAATNELQVTSLKMKGEKKETTKKDEMQK
jgi:hypothetical protein